MTSGDEEHYVVSDTERRDALASLVQAATAGQVTLDEFSRRTDIVLGARSRRELVAARADLSVSVAPGRVKRRWFVPFGNRVRRGRFVLPERTTAVILAGEIHLDLRGATLVGPEPTIKLWVLMGNLRVLAPRGIHVEVDSSSFFGGRTIAAYGPPPSEATPVLRIRMIDVLGAVKVTDDPTLWSPNLTSPEVAISPPTAPPATPPTLGPPASDAPAG
ncbi:MAG: DUF1707 domain-containing protein [Acidimicrobiales bacterium]